MYNREMSVDNVSSPINLQSYRLGMRMPSRSTFIMRRVCGECRQSLSVTHCTSLSRTPRWSRSTTVTKRFRTEPKVAITPFLQRNLKSDPSSRPSDKPSTGGAGDIANLFWGQNFQPRADSSLIVSSGLIHASSSSTSGFNDARTLFHF